MVVTKKKIWTYEDFWELEPEELIAMWKDLPAPDMQEMNGEYAGYAFFPSHNEEERIRMALFLYDEFGPLGYWFGKCYFPIDATRGEGYNCHRMPNGKLVRYMRYATEIGPSFIDGKPSLLMFFGAFNPGDFHCDEMRKLDDGIYIGTATSPRLDGTWTPPTAAFVLLGRWNRAVGPDADRLVEKWNEPAYPAYGNVQTPQRLMRKTKEQLIAMWKTLPAVDIKELCGEYAGYAPWGGGDQAAREKRVVERMYSEASEQGLWFGPAYLPSSSIPGVSVTKGEGYNIWRKMPGKILRNLRFRTEMGTSLIDGKPASMMYYGAYNNSAGERDRTDQIRKVDEGLYIGVSSEKNPDGSRTEPDAFIVVGPNCVWNGVDDEKAELK
jgi:hypothetical protein